MAAMASVSGLRRAPNSAKTLFRSMVMFHHEIPYRTALERGTIQAELLAELTAGAVTTLAQVDFDRAEREICSRLASLA